MSATKLLNKIFDSPMLCKEIIFFLDGNNVNPDKIDKDRFVKICKKHRIDLFPSILFDVFDSAGIKIAIVPIHRTMVWCSRVYTKEQILIRNDYTNRAEATLKALESATAIYIDSKNESKVENESKKQTTTKQK